jgi:hypothetical protein
MAENLYTRWASAVIDGPAGLEAFEAHELAIPHHSERVSAVIWALRTLGNDLSADTQAVVDGLVARRAELRTRGAIGTQPAMWRDEAGA